MLDNEIHDNRLLASIMPLDIGNIREQLCNNAYDEPFYIKKNNSDTEFFIFYPINNFNGDVVAYLISFKNIKNIKWLKNSTFIIIIILVITFIGLIFFYLYDIKNKKMLVNITTIDFLTGSLLRRTIIERIEVEISRLDRYKRPLSIIMFDLDHFKWVNDTYGHQTGDEVLKLFVNFIKESIRPSDSIGRYGGEEFILLLPETNREDAIKTAQKLNKDIKNVPFPENIKLTASCGVEEYKEGSVDELISAVDVKLYKAKKTGRDKVVG